jgi:tartrate dehydrogenase/decarboxylase/D-malate dehydrogenase
MADYTIAVIPGDGIGRDVVPEGIRALDAVAAPAGLHFAWQTFDWSCESFLVTGLMMPEDGLDQLGSFDAIFLRAVGFPGVA